MKYTCWSGLFLDGATPGNDSLALNKPVWLSSVVGSGWEAFLALDGNVNTGAATAQSWPYFGLDFEGHIILETISIIGKYNGDGN